MKLFNLATTTVAACLAATVALAQDEIKFGTNWLAQGAHGGYYQAVADGTYAEYDLDVEIIMGGPQVNNRPMLPAGRLDFLMGGNMLQAFDAARNGIPTTVVAAIFQKDPQAILAHKGQYDSFADAANANPIYIGKDGQFSFWQWMTANHGYSDENLQPYTYNIGPFLSDKAAVQQAFATSEPIAAADAGFETDIFLLADNGWDTYSTTIEARTDMIAENPELVQRFVDASIIGWYNFLYGDNDAALDLIIEANPELTKEKLQAEVELLKSLGIVDSGLSLEQGIGAMAPERTAAFLTSLEAAGVIDEGAVDLDLVADYSFVNKNVGSDLRN